VQPCLGRILESMPRFGKVRYRNPKRILVLCRFVLPACSLAWYPIEFDRGEFYGYVRDGTAASFGYFSQEYLESIRGDDDTEVELEEFTVETSLAEVMTCPVHDDF
jgi:hypothetical protein